MNFILLFDRSLKILDGKIKSNRNFPDDPDFLDNLTEKEKKISGALMRVNHVGEVCAQALYESQSYFSSHEKIRKELLKAKDEEIDHLMWTQQRLKELDSRPSFLNPIWYLGSFLLGALAAKSGDKNSLGFVYETEIQVENHLTSHLKKLPISDIRSRKVLHQMRDDEKKHGMNAKEMGAKELNPAFKIVMKIMSKIMTSTSYYV